MCGDLTGFALHLLGFGLGTMHDEYDMWDGLVETDYHSSIDH
jgi:hypothetical protein